ncbi:hypothetical protein BST81_07955 [Leptolyngbya sp. 'hensonii']|uniref:hypothetical protein n=1 Tax=Leptolyngbya sp. 'hensonii' TaxID=1922337 RepID=UPI0009669EB1|nr:hypothetical protein [Leptolyngbya sp. 'hensonii']OLP18843.1 hypothetical protein BST81_07955 [Leptolyngbya sp. 'hensonii']
MRAISSALIRLGLIVVVFVLVRAGCQPETQVERRNIRLTQTWELQPGDRVGKYAVIGGLGDISIELKGNTIYAPFNGQVQPFRSDCVVFSSDEVPAYLFRLCGLKRPQLGGVESGQPIGSGEYLQFATLRKQPGGTWSFVEPSRNILERTLTKP